MDDIAAQDLRTGDRIIRDGAEAEVRYDAVPKAHNKVVLYFVGDPCPILVDAELMFRLV